MDRLGVTVCEKAGQRASSIPHHRNREGAAAPSRQDHPLRGRREPAPIGSRLRVDRYPQRCLERNCGPAVDVGHRRGSDWVQLASIFNAFGSEVQLFQAGPRILPTEDEDVSEAVAAAFRRAGIAVREDFGAIVSFEKTPSGVQMVFSKVATRGVPMPRPPSSRWGGWPTPPGSIWPGQASRPMRGAMCGWTPHCGLLRRTSTQRATSPAA